MHNNHRPPMGGLSAFKSSFFLNSYLCDDCNFFLLYLHVLHLCVFPTNSLPCNLTLLIYVEVVLYVGCVLCVQVVL